MLEAIILVVLIFLYAFAFLFAVSLRERPSQERSRTLYRRSVPVFLFCVVLAVLWYAFDRAYALDESVYIGQVLACIAIGVLALLQGARHWRKYQEFTRTSDGAHQDVGSQSTGE